MSFFNSLAKLRKGDQAKAFGCVNGGRTMVYGQSNHPRGFVGGVGKVELKN